MTYLETWSNDLNKDFARFKKNRENVPFEILTTRYKRAYTELCNRLLKELRCYANHLACMGIGPVENGFSEAQADSWRLQIQQIVDEEKEKGIGLLLAKAIFADLSLSDFEKIVLNRITKRVTVEVYAPYWREHCIIHWDGKIVNDIVGMKWCPALRMWEGDWDGSPYWAAYLPPYEMTK